MKILPWLLGVAGIVLLGTALCLGIWAGMPANPLATLGILISQSGAFVRLTYPLLWIIAIWILVLVVMRMVGRSMKDPSLLTVLSLLPSGLGLVASLLTGLSIRRAMVNTNTTELIVIAPSVAEALAVLAIGLLVGAGAAALKATSPATREA